MQIDIPSFIRRIADANLRGAAQTILDANPLGGMCARVCPTEDLCEKVCVRNTQQGVPVAIGRLQRHAVDALMRSPRHQRVLQVDLLINPLQEQIRLRRMGGPSKPRENLQETRAITK